MSDQDTLLVYAGDLLVREAPLTRPDILIGRSQECDVVLDQLSVSRRHARLTQREGVWLIENLSASAPVQHGGAPLAGAGPMQPGEGYSVGPFTLVLRAARRAPARQETAITTPEAPTLTVSYGASSVDYPLSAPAISVGRSPDNTIVIPVSTVSRHHALIQQTPGGYVIRDQNSSNGLLYNGAHVAEHLLADGDTVRIGDDLGNFVTMSYRAPSTAAAGPPVVLSVSASQPEVRIGRAPDNTLVLNYPDVSAYHARIRWQAGGAVLEDLGSTNGTYLRGARVRTQVLQNGDLIQIAGRQIVYEADTVRPVEDALVRLDAIQLTTTVSRGAVTLLRQVSLSIAPRELVAIVGGSGAGKSTLMKALCGIRPATSGQVLVNGEDFYRAYGAYRRSIGYVPQDDIIHLDLTVERTLSYAARLRLPVDTTPAEIDRRVDEVLESVQLSHVRATEVGRLSGGQRKRVSIAVELLSQPQLFFLDEPTTGLDPGLDKRTMTLLRQFADQGRTVVLVTHATANIAVCDKVVFLARGGRMCFFGPPHEALTFFGAGTFAEIYALLDQSPQSGAEWEERFARSPAYQRYVAQPLAAAGAQAPPPSAPPARPPRPGGWRQWRIVTARSMERIGRDRLGLLSALAPAPAISALLALFTAGGVFEPGTSPLEAQRLLFLLMTAAILLGASTSVREIVKELPVYTRERLVNLRLAPYLGSKVAALGLIGLAQSILLLSVVLWRTGLPPEGALLPSLIELTIGVWLATLAGTTLGLVISAFAATVDQAVSLLPLVMLAQILLCGLIFPLPEPLRPISALTAARWSIDSAGTTADLNRLYYLYQASAPPGIRPLTIVPVPNYSLASYDVAAPRAAYTVDSHRASRRAHLAGRWALLAVHSLALLALAGALLRRHDQR